MRLSSLDLNFCNLGSALCHDPAPSVFRGQSSRVQLLHLLRRNSPQKQSGTGIEQEKDRIGNSWVPQESISNTSKVLPPAFQNDIGIFSICHFSFEVLCFIFIGYFPSWILFLFLLLPFFHDILHGSILYALFFMCYFSMYYLST